MNQDVYKRQDVHLLFRPAEHVRDYTVATPVDFEKNRAEVEVRINEAAGNPRITCELWDKDNLLGECAVEDGKASFPVEAPVLWNAEEPYQYILKIKTPEEILIQRVRCV